MYLPNSEAKAVESDDEYKTPDQNLGRMVKIFGCSGSAKIGKSIG